jgi:hypothetical protein
VFSSYVECRGKKAIKVDGALISVKGKGIGGRGKRGQMRVIRG